MFDTLKLLFSYDFIVRAMIAGGLVALCCALLGVSLVLNRFSMIGDGLSHVGFGALSVAAVMNVAPLAIAVPVVIVAAFFILKLGKDSKVQSDSIAIGVTVTSLSGGLNTDVYSYMFGSILAMSKTDVYISVALSVAVLVLFLVFYHKIFAITFDSDFAKATGVKAEFYNMLIAVLTALTIVVGMRIMGTMLISSLIIFPALSAGAVVKGFRKVVIISGIVSVVCFFAGLYSSYSFNLPVGASIVLANFVVFSILMLVGKLKRK
jgi:zinc transport system permease protein